MNPRHLKRGQSVIRQQGANHLKPQDIPDKLDEDLPQQAIVSAFRKYTK